MQICLVTGASSGIGHELAKLFARDGFDMVLVARDAARLAVIADQLNHETGVTVTVLVKDLSDADAPDELVRALHDRGIEPDVLVNNAGFDVYGLFRDTDATQESQMMQVNIVSLTRLTKLLLPGMLERGHGRILNLGSTGSFAPGPFNAVYCASKAYVLSFSEALAQELRGSGVTVTTLCPGATKTQFAQRTGMTDTRLFQGRVSDAAQVARAGYRALMQGRTRVIVGLANRLMIFSLRFAPRDRVARISRLLLSRIPGG